MSNPLSKEIQCELQKALVEWRKEVFRESITGYNKNRQSIPPAKPIMKEKRK